MLASVQGLWVTCDIFYQSADTTNIPHKNLFGKHTFSLASGGYDGTAVVSGTRDQQWSPEILNLDYRNWATSTSKAKYTFRSFDAAGNRQTGKLFSTPWPSQLLDQNSRLRAVT